MLEILILVLVFVAIFLIVSQPIPLLMDKLQQLQNKRVNDAQRQLSGMFIYINRDKLTLFYALAPLVSGLIGFILFDSLLLTLISFLLGFTFPVIYIKVVAAKRKARFQHQLIDGLMILSSSLKGGLSLLQAIEVLVEEMPEPISQEFGLLLREQKMGVSLEDSFRHLKERMKLEELELLVNATLVAREIGGDLSKVFARLVVTIRNNRKLKDSVRTLTMQGKMQGLIMSVMPVLFVWWVAVFNRRHFEVMFNSELGRMLLLVALVLQVVGMYLIRKFSTIKI